LRLKQFLEVRKKLIIRHLFCFGSALLCRPWNIDIALLSCVLLLSKQIIVVIVAYPTRTEFATSELVNSIDVRFDIAKSLRDRDVIVAEEGAQ